MKNVFVLFIVLHGLIHLMGFVKAFDLADIPQLTQAISRPMGLLWLLTAVLFLLTVGLMISGHTSWPVVALLAILLSQFLIWMSWQDAKFGTLINVLILVVAGIAYAQMDFRQMVEAEQQALLEQIIPAEKNPIGLEQIQNLPPPVQLWLKSSGAVGQPPIQQVKLSQSLQMKLKPEQSTWYPAKAKQWITVDPPAFIWDVEVQMNAFLSFFGRDRFSEGAGEMLIKLLGVFPVVDEKKDEAINQGALQRYLAEIIWLPSAALSPYIKWEAIDALSARATLSYGGTSGSGVFYFDSSGQVTQFKTNRYRKEGDSNQLTEWIITNVEFATHSGYRIPVRSEVAWRLEGGLWTWLKLQIESITYE